MKNLFIFFYRLPSFWIIIKSAKLAMAKVALLTLCIEVWFFLRSNTFTSSAMHVLLLNFFDNVSQSLPNQEFVSILVKRWIFSKGHPYCIFIHVSCPAIFFCFRIGVIRIQLHFRNGPNVKFGVCQAAAGWPLFIIAHSCCVASTVYILGQ